MPSGGKNNYSQYVAELAGYCAGGGYSLPRARVDAVAMPTPGLVAGSMRGFGGPQAAFALETLIDQIAVELGVDAIELRRQNAFEDGDRTVTGAPLLQKPRIREICDRALRNPLWTDRPPRERGRERYGVGFALANQAYGTGSDGVMAAVTLEEDGRLVVTTNAVDMGNGAATRHGGPPVAQPANVPTEKSPGRATSMADHCNGSCAALMLLLPHTPSARESSNLAGNAESNTVSVDSVNS